MAFADVDEPGDGDGGDDDYGDDLLRLIFTACHPVLSTEARIALTLRLLGGLSTDEIARAFLVPEPTVAQRIVRAKRTLAEARVPFEVPRPEERDARLASVLEVIYLIFNEGYSATSGGDWMRPALCDEALRLGRVLAELATQEPEVHGLVALMGLFLSKNYDPIPVFVARATEHMVDFPANAASSAYYALVTLYLSQVVYHLQCFVSGIERWDDRIPKHILDAGPQVVQVKHG